MKRVKSACLYQTLSFVLDPHFETIEARKKVEIEVEKYKKLVGENLQIINEKHFEDGSYELEVRKKVSGYSIGKYFE